MVFLGESQNCPTRSYQEIWELVLNELEGLGYTLKVTSSSKTEDNLFRLLFENFERHYLTNRAPFGLHVDLSWLATKQNLDSLQLFLDVVLGRSDVWFVTNWQAIKWMQQGTTKQFDCEQRTLQPQEIVCDVPNICKVEGLEEVFYTCSECPKKYPWFKNEFGNIY